MIEDLASMPARKLTSSGALKNGFESCGFHSQASISHIADELIRVFRPRKVLDARCGSGALVKALRDRDIEAWGIDESDLAIANADAGVRPFCRMASLSDALPDRYDLIYCAGVFEFAEENEALAAVQNLTSAADCLLLSLPGVETETSLLRLLEWFTECGFSPNIGLDVSSIAPQAVSLSRKPGFSGDVLRLFSECVYLRYAASAHFPGAENGRPSADAGLLAQVANYKDRIAVLQDQLAREREYLETLRSIQAHLMQEARRLRQAARPAGDGVAPAPLNEVVSVPSSHTLAPVVDHPGISRLEQQHADLQAKISHLEHRSAALESTVHHQAMSIDSILQSRIWRTLVSISAIVLRIMPGKR